MDRKPWLPLCRHGDHTDAIQVLISNNADMGAHPLKSYMTPARPAKRQRLGATEW